MEPKTTDRSVNLKTRPNWDVVLRALNAGVEVKIDQRKYCMVKAGFPIIAVSGVYESTHDVICFIATSEVCGVEHRYTFPIDFSINDFIAMCDRITEEEKLNIITTQVLKEVNDERYSRTKRPV